MHCMFHVSVPGGLDPSDLAKCAREGKLSTWLQTLDLGATTGKWSLIDRKTYLRVLWITTLAQCADLVPGSHVHCSTEFNAFRSIIYFEV